MIWECMKMTLRSTQGWNTLPNKCNIEKLKKRATASKNQDNEPPKS